MVYKGKKSTAGYVTRGYGQVEPNHLSAQRTGQIYAQLPTASDIDVLENGQFVKYNYGYFEEASDGKKISKPQVDFEGDGEWMLVFNEIKLYRDEEEVSDFAMVKGDYLHRVYSPSNGDISTYQSRYYGPNGFKYVADANTTVTGNQPGYAPTTAGDADGHITTPARAYVNDSTANPFANNYKAYQAKLMNDKYAMVPRVLKTNIGDIFTTNTIKETTLALGNELVVGQDGYLKKKPETGNTETMIWQVVKLTTMPDGQ